MRQDRRFRPGEAVTSTQFAKAVSSLVDWLVTVDPHLHRRAALSDIYTVPVAVASAAPLIAEWIRTQVSAPALVGPDAESEQWVATVTGGAEAPYFVLGKTRRGDREVEISIPDTAPWAGRTPVIVDDIISSGRTMIEAVRQLRHRSLPPASCVGIHALFADTAYEDLLSAGAANVVTCNTVPHASNMIDITGALVDAVRETSS